MHTSAGGKHEDTATRYARRPQPVPLWSARAYLVPRHRAATQHAVARARFAGVIGAQTQLSTGWRRIAAFSVDYGFIFAYLGLLTLVGMLGRIVVTPPTDIATPAGRVVAQLGIFAVLTVPVTVWFAGWEATAGGATPGKRLLGLRVLTTSGDRLTWPRSLVRTALKFTIPWELAHTAVWNMLVWPGDRGAAVDTLLLSLANAALVVDVVSLFIGSRRTPLRPHRGHVRQAIRPGHRQEREMRREIRDIPAERARSMSRLYADAKLGIFVHWAGAVRNCSPHRGTAVEMQRTLTFPCCPGARTRRPEAIAPGQPVKAPGPKRPHATKAIRAR